MSVGAGATRGSVVLRTTRCYVVSVVGGRCSAADVRSRVGRLSAIRQCSRSLESLCLVIPPSMMLNAANTDRSCSPSKGATVSLEFLKVLHRS